MITAMNTGSLLVKQVICIIVGLVLLKGGNAQQGGILKQADDFFSKEDYYKAAQLYEHLLGDSTRKALIYPYTANKVKKAGEGKHNYRSALAFKAAESYRRCHNFIRAEKWYAIAVREGYLPKAPALYGYGVSLRANEKFTEAEEQFKELINGRPDENYSRLAHLELNNLNFIQSQLQRKEKAGVTIEKSGLQKEGAFYAASINDSALWFTATWPTMQPEAFSQDLYNNRLYLAAGTELAKALMVQFSSLPKGHIGHPSITADGRHLYFTHWIVQDGKQTAAIYHSRHSGAGWGTPVLLNELVNKPGYRSMQPFVTPDGGYLLFASNQPGGLGKNDLWLAQLNEDGNPITAKNMGETINTVDDDETPFYHDASQTLVFSSNGRVGMGGFDLFQSKGKLSQLEAPLNLGYPFNSVKDDQYYAASQKEALFLDGWISSDRFADCCLELLKIKALPKRSLITQVVDCKTAAPLHGAAVQVFKPDALKEPIHSFVLDSTNHFVMERDASETVSLIVSKDGYRKDTLVLKGTQYRQSADTLLLELCPLERLHTTRVVLFAFDEANIDENAIALLNQVVTLLQAHPNATASIHAYTDGKGTELYNLALADKRLQACMNFLIKAGVEHSRLDGKAHGECCPLENEIQNKKDNPAARSKNRRVEIVIKD